MHTQTLGTQPSTRRRRPAAPKQAYLHRDDDGTITALSSSGRDVYVLRNDHAGNWTCTCPAGQNGRACYHRTAAQQRFPGFFARPAALIIAAHPEPEPPTPAAPARRLAHSCDLYGPGDCRACRAAA